MFDNNKVFYDWVDDEILIEGFFATDKSILVEYETFAENEIKKITDPVKLDRNKRLIDALNAMGGYRPYKESL